MARFDPSTLFSNLRPAGPDLWGTDAHREISYPKRGNSACFELEDASFWFRHRRACILAAADRFPPGGALIDIGAGNGHVASALVDAGHDVVAIEPGSEGAARIAARRIPTVRAAFDALDARPGALPAAGLFDVVEHVEQEQGFLGALQRAMAPEARLYVTVPALPLLWAQADLDSGHFRRYTIGSLGRSLARAGFEVEYATYFFAPLILPIFLARTLPYRLRKLGASAPPPRVLHVPAGTKLGRGSERLLASELRAIREGRRVPCGSSILAVARRLP